MIIFMMSSNAAKPKKPLSCRPFHIVDSFQLREIICFETVCVPSAILIKRFFLQSTPEANIAFFSFKECLPVCSIPTLKNKRG